MLRTAWWPTALAFLAACGGSDGQESLGAPEMTGTQEQRLALFDYGASLTSNATNPDQSADSWIYLGTNEPVMLGTCDIHESMAFGNTFLRLFDPSGVEVASNDDGAAAGCGGGSKLGYVAPAAGYYMVRAGCHGLEFCSGTVAFSRGRGSYAFSGVDTSNATINTYNRQFRFDGGDVIRVSTCALNALGAAAYGDTYLRLFRQSYGLFTEVAAVDTTVGCGTSAELVYTIPAAGYYQVRAGCAGATSCGGIFAVYVE